MASSTQKARNRRANSKVRDRKPVEDANSLAYSLTQNASPANLDLKTTVVGYTHRGGFKLGINNIEELTDNLIEQWKAKCRGLGYECKISYNASLSTALLHAFKPNKSPLGGTQDKPKGAKVPVNFFARVHPLTIVAAALFAVNAGRHYLSS